LQTLSWKCRKLQMRYFFHCMKNSQLDLWTE
jgi:hypothetical protein